ncbi:hypothetical protein U9M48_011768 [Paspalum notatum var. saurae]|uniref:Uncharacterized protein n=1 Tax=Paspalum notatum var. saurae TaxID=547442 RepID=A0AAQ3WHU7_PASNO
MALRALLRRIPDPVRRSPSGPCLGPVHCISPAVASRFMSTRSEGEHHLEKLNHHQSSINKDGTGLKAESLAEYSKAIDNLRKVGNAAAVVILAIPAFMIIGSSYNP